MKYLVFALIALALNFQTASAVFLPPVPKEPVPYFNLTYDQAMSNAFHFKKLLDSIPADKRVGIKNQKDLDDWLKEIVPYFEYEYIVEDKDPGDYMGLVYPKVSFDDYKDGTWSHHLLGQTQIFNHDITLNNRIENPISPWYGREDSIMVLVHELCHAQGIVYPAPNAPIDEEASAQLCALEVAASMVNQGNKLVLPGLLDELVNMNLQAAHYLALKDLHNGDWTTLVKFFDERRTMQTPWENALSDKSERQWAMFYDKDQFPYILFAYNYLPMAEIQHGFENGDLIYGVKLPINWLVDMVNTPGGYEGTPGGYGVKTIVQPDIAKHIGASLSPLPLLIDDLDYFYNHAGELTSSANWT